MGTDTLGRDLLARILVGARISFLVGFAATFVSLVIGVIWGGLAGYCGGKIDSLMMRIADALYALPFIIFIILLTVVFGRHLLLLFLAIGAVEWLTMARVVRGQVAQVRQAEFVLNLKGFGFSHFRILFLHILPNILGPIVAYTTLTIPSVMLLEAFLSYLGLGVQAPMSSWGSLMASGVEGMEEYPWLLWFPALGLGLTLMSLHFLGEGLRDYLDPKKKQELLL